MVAEDIWKGVCEKNIQGGLFELFPPTHSYPFLALQVGVKSGIGSLFRSLLLLPSLFPDTSVVPPWFEPGASYPEMSFLWLFLDSYALWTVFVQDEPTSGSLSVGGIWTEGNLNSLVLINVWGQEGRVGHGRVLFSKVAVF